MAVAKKEEGRVLQINPLDTNRIFVSIVGTSPLYMHRFAFKAWQELLLPAPEKNKKERALTLKHDPLAEYRGSFYRNRDPEAPTLFHLPNGMVHGAMSAAALRIPGAFRTEIEQLTSIASLNINLYGVPRLKMDMVRNSDINHTPDVRTRPLFKRWACSFEVEYVVKPLNDKQIVNLLAAAGLVVGLGDWRPQKKGGAFGRFRVADESDDELIAIIANGDRTAQQEAFDNPVCYDDETDELLAWYNAEIIRRADRGDQGGKAKPIRVTAHQEDRVTQ